MAGVLSLGLTGSGYMAALLANRARHVLTVDIVPELVELARTNLANAGITNVDVAEGNAADGWAAAAPYDVICISGSLPTLPQSILSQVKVGGRIAAFVGELPVMEARLITRVSETEYQVVNLFETAVARQATRLASVEQPTDEQLLAIEEDDILEPGTPL